MSDNVDGILKEAGINRHMTEEDLMSDVFRFAIRYLQGKKVEGNVDVNYKYSEAIRKYEEKNFDKLLNRSKNATKEISLIDIRRDIG